METNNKKVLLRISHLKQWFPLKKTKLRQEQLYVKANDGISVDIYEGETLGLVGESGCGKSTFGRVLLQLYHQTEGKTMYYGRSIDWLAPKYVEDVMKHLPKKIAFSKELTAKYESIEKEYAALDEKGKRGKKAELDKAKKEADSALLDVTQIVGGFYVADDLQPIMAAFLKEYYLAVELHKLENTLNEQQIRLNEVNGKISDKKKDGKSAGFLEKKAASQQAKVDRQKKVFDKKAEELAASAAAVEALRHSYDGNAEFAKYEAMRDDGIDLAKLTYMEMRQLRKDVQLIFQDPYSSLNPRMTVGQIIGEGLTAHHFFRKNDAKMQDYVMQVMENCGLAPYMIHRYPHQFSGGQRQRIGIARSLALNPKFVVCDEAVSALDVSIQSQIINLLQDLKEREHLTYLFISHDLSVVKYISDRIGVMYLGNLVELAESEDMFTHPLHPYTEALLLAIPTTDVGSKKRKVELLEGDIPSPVRPPKGCKFHTRCRYCTDVCKEVEPDWVEVRPGHFVACHHPLDHTVIQ